MSYYKNMIKVFAGCCSSAFLMEIMMEKSPDSVNFVTFLQFFFTSLLGLVTIKSRMFKPQIPLKEYFKLISLFFVTSVANNYVYALHVPSTLHMIIRSASSPASMIVCWYAKKQRPRTTAIIGSIVISIGVSLATYGDATVVEERKGSFLHWCLGVTILLTMLIFGALTGLQQEILFRKFGKHPEENHVLFKTSHMAAIMYINVHYIPGCIALHYLNLSHTEQMLFFTYTLPLPLFLSIYPQLRSIASNLSSDFWLILFINIISQFYCTHSVHELATRENSTTVTFILTLRKFVSLLISSIVFKNNLTILHVLGTVLVIMGTCLYFDFFTGRKQQPVSYKDTKPSIHKKDKSN